MARSAARYCRHVVQRHLHTQVRKELFAGHDLEQVLSQGIQTLTSLTTHSTAENHAQPLSVQLSQLGKSP
eukprot:2563106-Rhodomonas_salina.1